MKNLANCTPSEFFAQTVKIKKVVQEWMEATDIIGIMQTKVDLEKLPENPTPEQKKEVFERNVAKVRAQGMDNFSRMFDAAFEKNPQKTLNVLALCCFVDPARVDDNPMKFYLKSITELINDEDIINFFTSLAQLAQRNTSMQ